MFTKLKPVFIIAGRELKDQFRDWRVLAPMAVLVLCFPILMNAFAQQSVDFLNRYNANLIIDRLVPFSILIIGFFPITVSLVVALEAFVGEKERGTIEPILSSPLEDWQIYFGKLLVGVATPLIASYLSFGLYMLLVIRRDLTLPSSLTIIQLILLTTAHAFLMVSAAIVISVQSTSVKAANLLASFIVIPVAILMQGEAGMLFWGNDNVLWWAVLGVTIVALLLIRLGLAHFQREYLLGREIDAVNLRWLWHTFWRNFLGGARSVPDWYRSVVGPSFKKIVPSIFALLLVATVSVLLSYMWVMKNMPAILESAPKDQIARFTQNLRETPDLKEIREKVSAPYLFLNNTRAVFVIFLAGVVSFSVLGVLAYMLNIALIGGLFGVVQLLGIPAWPLFIGGVLPHGIFEIPALIAGSAAMLYFGVSFVTPQTGRSFGEAGIELFADWCKIFVGIVVPLMAIAAVIETYITPHILINILN
ncbi:MAG: stage II sporulation protein M [Anaerolineales bacterium]|nr:stage II sporulation protein M [Anaerolineales bacterium]